VPAYGPPRQRRCPVVQLPGRHRLGTTTPDCADARDLWSRIETTDPIDAFARAVTCEDVSATGFVDLFQSLSTTPGSTPAGLPGPSAHDVQHQELRRLHRSRGPRSRPMRTFAVESLVERPQHTGGNHRHRTRTEGPGRTPKGVGDHEIYRSPEAGAQVRILPGAPRLTCSYYAQKSDCLSVLAASWTKTRDELSPRFAPRRSSAGPRWGPAAPTSACSRR
jgi:hypothetical protein